jgi:hypothetical protein
MTTRVLTLFYRIPYILTEVRDESLAYQYELYEGDHVIAVNQREALTMTHFDLKSLVKSCARFLFVCLVFWAALHSGNSPNFCPSALTVLADRTPGGLEHCSEGVPRADPSVYR